MEARFRDLPSSEAEYLLLIAMYKTKKELIWNIIHYWYKRYGLPLTGSACYDEQPISMQYYYRFLQYIKDN